MHISFKLGAARQKHSVNNVQRAQVHTMEDYFSIDDILSSEPRVYSEFKVRGHTLGHLRPELGADQLHLNEGSRVALPFWLCEALAERAIVDIILPRCFGKGVRNALRADAIDVNLYQKCAAYYALGVSIAKLVKDNTLPLMLVNAYATRAWNIVDAAAYGAVAPTALKRVAKLDCMERELFFVARAAQLAVNRWKENATERILPCDAVLGKRKREVQTVTSPVTPRQRVC